MTAPTLTEFLLARIAEDGATDAGLPHRDSCRQFGGWPGDPGSAVECSCGVSDRVLAVCEAHRRIVEAHPRSVALDYCETCFSGDFGRLDDPLHEDWPCPTLRALAAVYRDHEDWREEWMP